MVTCFLHGVRKVNNLTIAWRTFWALWHISWFFVDVFSQTNDNTSYALLRYLPNWGFILLIVTSWVDLITSLVEYRKDFKVNKDQIWILVDTAKCTALEISIGYYLYLIWVNEFEVAKAIQNFPNLLCYAFNAFYIGHTIFVTAKPVRLFLWAVSVVLACVYMAISIILQRLLATVPAYLALIWLLPRGQVICVTLYLHIAPVVIHCFVFVLYKSP